MSAQDFSGSGEGSIRSVRRRRVGKNVTSFRPCIDCHCNGFFEFLNFACIPLCAFVCTMTTGSWLCVPTQAVKSMQMPSARRLVTPAVWALVNTIPGVISYRHRERFPATCNLTRLCSTTHPGIAFATPGGIPPPFRTIYMYTEAAPVDRKEDRT